MTTTDVVAAVQDAATVDSRAFYTLPSLLDVIGDDPQPADAVALLRGWQERGAHRLDQDRDGAYEEQAASRSSTSGGPGWTTTASRRTC